LRTPVRKYHRGVDLISDALSFDSSVVRRAGRKLGNAIGCAKLYSRSRDAVIRVYDKAGNLIDTHEHAGEFKEW